MPILGMALHHHRMLASLERRPWPQSHCRFGRCPSWPPLVAASGCSLKLRRGRWLHGHGKLGVPIISVALCNGRQPKNPMIGVQHRRPIPGDPIYVNRCARRRGPCVGSSTCFPSRRRMMPNVSLCTQVLPSGITFCRLSFCSKGHWRRTSTRSLMVTGPPRRRISAARSSTARLLVPMGFDGSVATSCWASLLHGHGKLEVPIFSVALCNGRQPKNPMIGV